MPTTYWDSGKHFLKHPKKVTKFGNTSESLKLDFRPILDAYNLLGYGETLSGKSGKQLTNPKMFKTYVTNNVYNTCLKLDVRPILDAYNLLGYGETLSE